MRTRGNIDERSVGSGGRWMCEVERKERREVTRGRVDGTEVQVVEEDDEECGGIGERENRKMERVPSEEVELEM